MSAPPAAYLFDELLAAGGEFGIEIDGFTTEGT